MRHTCSLSRLATAARSRAAPLPPTLPDSPIAFESVSAWYSADLGEAVEPDDGFGFIVAGPSAEVGAALCGAGPRAFGMEGFLLCGLACKRGGAGVESGTGFDGADVLARSSGPAGAVLAPRQAGDDGPERHRAERPEGGGLQGDALKVDALGRDGAEQVFAHPAPPGAWRDPARRLDALAPVAGPHPLVRRGHLGRGVDLARLTTEDGLVRQQTRHHGPVLRARFLWPGRAGRSIRYSFSGRSAKREKRGPAPAAGTLAEPGSHQAEQRAGLRLARHRGLTDKAVAPAGGADTRRGLGRQTIQTRHPRRRLCDHLLHRHLAGPQQPPAPHRTRAAAPPTPDRTPLGTGSDQTSRQQPTRPVHATVPAKRHSVGHPSIPLAQAQLPANTGIRTAHTPPTLTHKTQRGPDVCMREPPTPRAAEEIERPREGEAGPGLGSEQVCAVP